MLKPPVGRSPRDAERERVQRETVGLAVEAVATSRVAPAFPTPPPGAGTAAVGHLGFALGLSGLGGSDWLMPSGNARSSETRLFNEIR